MTELTRARCKPLRVSFQHWPLNLGRLFSGGLWLAACAPAFAMKQCPAEFGPKDPAVNALGWIVVALAVALGALLVYVVMRRSRNLRWVPRIAAIALGLIGMLCISVGGFALALVFFFLKC